MCNLPSTCSALLLHAELLKLFILDNIFLRSSYMCTIALWCLGLPKCEQITSRVPFLIKFLYKFNRADLANLVNEAALLAGRASKLLVGNDEFSRAVERSIAVRVCTSYLQSCQLFGSNLNSFSIMLWVLVPKGALFTILKHYQQADNRG